MNIMGAAAQAAAKAAAEAARRAAEAARKAAEAAARAAAEAAKQAAEAQKAQQAQPAKDANKAVTKDLKEAAGALNAAKEDFETLVQQAAGKLTCGAANKQMAMKEKDPADHDRLVKDLKETGQATTASGEKLYLSEKNEQYIAKQDLPEPAKNDLRIQAALMDYANDTEEYDLAADVSKGPDGSASRGLSGSELARLDNLDKTTDTTSSAACEVMAAVSVAASVFTAPFGGGVKSHEEALADQTAGKLQKAQEEGKALAIALEVTKDIKHAVTVVDVDDKADTVTVKDTAGTYVMSNAEFDEAVNAKDLDAGNITAQAGTSGGTAPTRRR